MEVIEAHFLRFKDWSLYDLLNGENQKGVYIIWDSSNKAKPSYIGQGKVIDRMAKHNEKYFHPIDGYLALFTGNKSTKHDVEIIETALLIIGDEVDRHPTQNSAAGNRKRIIKKFMNHGKIKIRVSGYDPFQKPSNSKKIENEKIIEIFPYGDNDFIILHPWKNRKKLKNY